MVRNGEHAESIITNCSPAIKGNYAIFLLYFVFMLGKQLKLVRICFTGIPENCQKNNPKSHHFSI